MRIFYIGPASGTSLARFKALEALGHDATIVDPHRFVPRSRFVRSWTFRTGAVGIAGKIARGVLSRVDGRYDLVFVDNGELVSAGLVRRLQAAAPRVINLNLDNPFVARDGQRWRLFRRAVPFYDVLYTPRESSIAPALALGAPRSERIWQAAEDRLIDPANHPSEAARADFKSKVSFTGTWMPERGAFMVALLDRGVPLRIFGPRWEKAPEYDRLKGHVVPGSLNTRQYEAAVSAADISIAIMSKGNEDIHTTRSLEIPTLGSLLCGERTVDHLALYDEGREAVFFSDADECARLCLDLLTNPSRLAAMREAGRQRAIANGHFNQSLMAYIIEDGLR